MLHLLVVAWAVVRWPVALGGWVLQFASIYFDGQDASQLGWDWWIWAVIGATIANAAVVSIAISIYVEKHRLEQWKRSVKANLPRIAWFVANSSRGVGQGGSIEIALKNEPELSTESAVARRVMAFVTIKNTVDFVSLVPSPIDLGDIDINGEEKLIILSTRGNREELFLQSPPAYQASVPFFGYGGWIATIVLKGVGVNETRTIPITHDADGMLWTEPRPPWIRPQ